MDEKSIPFSREDEDRIASTGLWGMIAGISSVSGAALGAILTLLTKGASAFIGQLMGLSFSAIMAIWLIQASRAFLKVATTDEADEHYLLLGFSKLRSYFKVSGILIIIVICLVVLTLLMALTCSIIFRS